MAETENMTGLQRYLNSCVSALWNDTDYYLSFLRTSAQMYKYGFQDQVLIHDSRPNAVACAESKTWCNDDIHRAINEGAMAIPLLTTNNGQIGLRFVYDYADTKPIDERSKSPYFWQVGSNDETAVMTALGGNSGDGLADIILKKAHETVSEQSEIYLGTLSDNIADTFLEELDELNLKTRFDDLLEKSVAYAVLSRCGISASAYFEKEDFREIHDFNSIGTMTVLGSAISDISEQLLRAVERTVKAERRNEYDLSQNTERENSLRTTDNIQSGQTNAVIYAQTGDVSAESNWEIRDNANELSQKVQQDGLSGNADERNAERASVGDRQDGAQKIGADDTADDESAGRNGTAESPRSDQVDRADEQYTSSGGGDSPKRTDIQLNNNAAELNGSAFSMPEYLIDGILKHDKFFNIKRDEIVEFFVSESDSFKRTEFMKTVFNNDFSEFDVNGVRCGYKALEDGLEMWVGNYLTKTDEAHLCWNEVTERVGELIKAHEYLLDDNTFDIEPEIEEMGGYDETVQLSLFDLDVPDETSKFEQNKLDAEENSDKDKQLSTNSTEERIVSEVLSMLDMTDTTADNVYDRITELLADMLFGEELTKDEETVVNELLNDDEVQFLAFETHLPDVLRTENAEKETEYNTTQSVEQDFDIPSTLEKFYVDKENELVTQVYYNPDSSAGGQLVYNRFSFEELSRAFEFSDPLDYIESISRQEAIDIDDPAFPEKAREFLANTEDFNSDEKDIYAKLSALLPRKAPLITQVAIESTEDYTDIESGFSSAIINPDVQNKDGSYGKVKEYYRLVMVGENGQLVPYNDTVYENFDDARKAISQNADIIEVAYDDIIHLSFEKRQARNLHGETHENNSPLANNEERRNFTITDEHLGEGTAKAKFRANINAIRLLNTLETENRSAAPDEQEILSKYVGWGGLAQAFDENNSLWSDEYMELLTLLSDEEYESAKASTLNAHYTSPTVISAIYEGLKTLGFENGNVLEPALGVGNFFGMMPEEMRQSSLYGVELDSISGRIAKQLYPNADIRVTGFENTDFPDNFFDVAVGNVPFGQYKLSEKRYDKLNLNIHDHFFAKSLDKIRAGGVIAFVTSKGTLDKENSKFRAYLAQRAELLGAIRLPNIAFKANAGTEVTSDIIFLQKRTEIRDKDAPLPDWVHLGKTENGVPINKYFEQHPEMVLGEMRQGVEFSMYGNPTETACVPIDGAVLKEQLAAAIKNIQGEIPNYVHEEPSEQGKNADSILADPNTRNFSFTVVNGNVFYRENGEMYRQNLPQATAERVKGMIEIRDCVRRLIDLQMNEYGDDDIKAQQTELNRVYDKFTAKYGLLNDTANSRAFTDDSSAPLLNSLEILTEDGKLLRKADMFTKRTIKQRTEVTHTDTAMDALAVSISEKAQVDMPFMEQLTGKSEDELVSDLKGVVYRVPTSDKSEKIYATADEYLSGNIREKLLTAQLAAELEPDVYGDNVTALEQAMPKPLEASEIDVRLGATWIDTDTIKQFIIDTIQPASYMYRSINVNYSQYTSEWSIDGKSIDHNNVMSTMTYGTERKNAYSIIEDTLNLRDARVYDRVEEDGKPKYVLNKKETTLAQEKQEAIKQAFKDWVFRDPERRETLVTKYNELFNSTRPREYDGSHLNFVGMSPEIQLRPHQLNAIAHTIYGGNTLLAHQVGAGKTFEMVASAMESKRLGLCHKSLFAVPNHLTEQMGAEFLRLYPSANILVATSADFEKKNRKRLVSKIATGNYDAIIIGHSQLKKIPLSQERQESMLRRQISEIAVGIEQLAKDKGQHFSVKQLAKTKKNLETRLKKLLDTPKDDVVTFEELGVDRMYIDEAHEFKNLFLYTKMRNVAGISTTDAEKSSDLYMKCQYMDELTGGKGIVFATGTPISNTMSEMYTMMRYLQAHKLQEMNMQNFDSWAANFGEPVTAIELAPEGTGYRSKTRFSKFFNLPELMSVFKEAADIKVADELNLNVPTAHFHNIVTQPSEFQKEMIQELAKRAADIRDKKVDRSVDNMPMVTNDGRKIGLDQRLMNPDLPDNPDSKVNTCVNNVFDIYTKTSNKKSTQLIFCDQSVPKKGEFNLYDDVRDKLVAMGVPKEQIAFIHEADTEIKKKELFAKVRSGKVRIMIGSTSKCGAGMNVQDKLVALHHLDCPWRPSDLEQREGRIIRQGNENPDVDVFRYVTDSTFDAYLYQIIENKQRFISQIMTSKSPVRSCEDIDETTLSYAEVKALCAGNPLIKEKMDLDVSVAKLKVLKANFTSQQYRLEDKVLKEFPQKIQAVEERIRGLEKDFAHFQTVKEPEEGISPMIIGGTSYTDKEQAGKALLLALKEIKSSHESRNIGSYKGFDLRASYSLFNNNYTLDIKRETTYSIELGTSDTGNIVRIDNALEAFEKRIEGNKQQLAALHQQLDTAKSEMGKPFPQEQELSQKQARLNELNAQLNMDERGADRDGDIDEDKPALPKKLTLDERIDKARKQHSAGEHQSDLHEQKKENLI